jgi:hypothetical protein
MKQVGLQADTTYEWYGVSRFSRTNSLERPQIGYCKPAGTELVIRAHRHREMRMQPLRVEEHRLRIEA